MTAVSHRFLCVLPVPGAVLQTVAFCHSRRGKIGSGDANRKESSWRGRLLVFIERPDLLGKTIHRIDSMGAMAALDAEEIIGTVGSILDCGSSHS